MFSVKLLSCGFIKASTSPPSVWMVIFGTGFLSSNKIKQARSIVANWLNGVGFGGSVFGGVGGG